VLDHRGPEFARLGKRVLEGMKTIFKCAGPVIIYPASGTGAWEAALSNTLSPGDKVLMVETGHFATLWKTMATKLGLDPEFIATDWRTGADPKLIEARLREDKEHTIKAVCVVHNETSTGCVTHVGEVRKAIDAAKHPALLLADTISSLGSIDYRHDEWGVDVTVGGSQKGLMLPPGLSFNALSDKAIAVAKNAKLPKSFWGWEEMIANNKNGFFPYTPATNLLYALAEAIDMLHEEGLENVFARHDRHAEATRRATKAWGLEIWCREPHDYSSSLTTLLLPTGHDADAFRKTALTHFDVSLGTGLSKLAGKVFRIGHLGDTNDLTIIGALAGVEMGLSLAGVPHKKGGVQAAMDYFAAEAKGNARAAA
jgi:alanine-glyoxylate transaminase/serine-glyoxylate transaminase/serine-pyruvate transaminase